MPGSDGSYAMNQAGVQQVFDNLVGIHNRLQTMLETTQTAVANYSGTNAGEASVAYSAVQAQYDQQQLNIQVAMKTGAQRLETIMNEIFQADLRGANQFG